MPKRKTLNLPGLPPIPVTDRDVGPDDVVICMRVEDMETAYFPDDLQGHCLVCFKRVCFRPYMKAGRKVCIRCAPALSQSKRT